jgi:hypothetical protein
MLKIARKGVFVSPEMDSKQLSRISKDRSYVGEI